MSRHKAYMSYRYRRHKSHKRKWDWPSQIQVNYYAKVKKKGLKILSNQDWIFPSRLKIKM
jgi:hypothetical protein